MAIFPAATYSLRSMNSCVVIEVLVWLLICRVLIELLCGYWTNKKENWNKSSELSYDAEFRLVSDASNSLTSPTKNSSLFGSHRAAMTDAMTMITSEMRKAKVPSLPSVDSYLVVTRFLCIFTSVSFRIEIVVFRIRICDVTLSSY